MRGGVFMVLMCACAGGPSDADKDTDTDTDAPADASDQPELPAAMRCDDAPLPPAAGGAFRHILNEALALTGDGHAADDLIFTDAGLVTFAAKFAYGPTSKDLEDEDVEVWIDDCTGSYRSLGLATTDSDGRFALSLDPSGLPGFGSFSLVYRVVGDGTEARATLSVFPEGTRLVVSDVDGTLTTSDVEVFRDLFSELGDGSYVPEARADAVAAMEARSTQGYPIVYLSGRPYLLVDITREWLVDLGFPAGTVQLVADVADVAPTDDAVGAYKLAYLDELHARGFILDFAYGNATTDIFAYLGAGVAQASTFILGDHGGEEGTVDLGEDYVDHAAALDGAAPVSQPFTW